MTEKKTGTLHDLADKVIVAALNAGDVKRASNLYARYYAEEIKQIEENPDFKPNYFPTLRDYKLIAMEKK